MTPSPLRFILDSIDSIDSIESGHRNKPKCSTPPERTTPINTKIIAFAAQKGGVGKTTSAVNLGAALAELGRKVLIIDLDPSGQITYALNLRDHIGADLASVVLGKSEASPADLITVHSSGLHIITWHPNMITLAENLYTERAREHKLARKLSVYKGHYDYILIDFAPTLGILTDSGLLASDNGNGKGCVIFPVEASKLMHGTLDLMIAQVDQLEAAFEIEFERLGMICGIYNEKDGHATKKAFQKLTERPFPMLGVVKRRTLFKEAMDNGVTIFEHAPDSDAADMFRHLAKEIEPK